MLAIKLALYSVKSLLLSLAPPKDALTAFERLQGIPVIYQVNDFAKANPKIVSLLHPSLDMKGAYVKGENSLLGDSSLLEPMRAGVVEKVATRFIQQVDLSQVVLEEFSPSEANAFAKMLLWHAQRYPNQYVRYVNAHGTRLEGILISKTCPDTKAYQGRADTEVRKTYLHLCGHQSAYLHMQLFHQALAHLTAFTLTHTEKLPPDDALPTVELSAEVLNQLRAFAAYDVPPAGAHIKVTDMLQKEEKLDSLSIVATRPWMPSFILMFKTADALLLMHEAPDSPIGLALRQQLAHYQAASLGRFNVEWLVKVALKQHLRTEQRFVPKP